MEKFSRIIFRLYIIESFSESGLSEISSDSALYKIRMIFLLRSCSPRQRLADSSSFAVLLIAILILINNAFNNKRKVVVRCYPSMRPNFVSLS